jgi:SSS family solute:Na+ symporter
MPSAILVLGGLTIIYTYRGGMRAVVWTEILQACVYLVGGFSAIVILGKSCRADERDSGARGDAGKLVAIDFSFDISKPHGLAG